MTLIKKPGRPYWIARFYVNGNVVEWSTQRTNKREADALAKQHEAHVRGGNTVAIEASKHAGAQTLAEQIDLYESVAKNDVREGTLQKNVLAVKQVIREVEAARKWFLRDDKGSTPDEQKRRAAERLLTEQVCPIGLDSNAALFTERHVKLWQDYRLQQAQIRAGTVNNKQVDRKARRSINSCWRQAKSLWNKRLIHPSTTCYRVVPPAAKALSLTGGTTDPYTLPEPALVLKVVRYFEALRDKEYKGLRGFGNKDIYAAFALAFHAGFRASEIEAARKQWLNNSCHIRVQEEPDFRPKVGLRNVPVDQRVWDWLNDYCQGRESQDRILGAANTEKVIREVNKRLKKLGWGGEKRIHDLRKFYGCAVAQQQSVYAAQKHLGHREIATTIGHYTNLNLSSVNVLNGVVSQDEVDAQFFAELRNRSKHVIRLQDGSTVTVSDAELQRLEGVAARKSVGIPQLLVIPAKPVQLTA